MLPIFVVTSTLGCIVPATVVVEECVTAPLKLPVVAVISARVLVPEGAKVVHVKAPVFVTPNVEVPDGANVVHVRAPVFVVPNVLIPVTPKVELKLPVVADRAARVLAPDAPKVVHVRAPVFVTPNVEIPDGANVVHVRAPVFVVPSVLVPVTPKVELKLPVVAVRAARVLVPDTPKVEYRFTAPAAANVETDTEVALTAAKVLAAMTFNVELKLPLVADRAAKLLAPDAPKVVHVRAPVFVTPNVEVPDGANVVHVRAPVFVTPKVLVPVTPKVELKLPVVADRAARVLAPDAPKVVHVKAPNVHAPDGAKVVQVKAPVFVTPKVLVPEIFKAVPYRLFHRTADVPKSSPAATPGPKLVVFNVARVVL